MLGFIIICNRHAIWELKPAPPPPPQAPLWQVSSQWRSDNGWNSHLGVLQQDLEDLELLEPFSPDNNSHNAVVDSSHYETTSSRHEALADALGVRKTPRKAVVDDLPPPRKLSSTVRSNRSHRKANVSLLSPALSMTTRLLNETTTQSIMDADNASVENSFSRPPLLTLGPFSSLHPNIAMTCLYEETTVTPQAETIFLASNLTGSGILNVCLVCPGNNNDISNPNELRQFSFEPSGDDAAAANHRFQDASSSGALLEGIGKIFFVAPKPTIPCVAAQPMETSPIPPCFHPHRRNRNLYWNGLASDILVLSNDKSGQGKLSLYRSCMYIVDCAIPNKSRTAADTITVASTVYDIENAVGNRIDIICSNDADEEICVRGSVSLMMDSSALGEKVLQTLESVLLSPNNNIFLQDRGQNVAMKIRADCARLEQMIAKRSKDDSSQPFFEDVGAAAVRSVVLSMFCVELLGDNVNYYDYKKNAASDHGGTTAWDRLLQSEYHQFYSTECQDFLFIDESKDHPGQSNRASKDNTFILGGEYLSQIHSFAVESITSLKNSISCTLFDALHALYEDFKLCGSLRDAGMRFLGTILCRVCQMIRSDSKGSKNIASLFMEHYRRDLGDLWFQQLVSSKGSPTSNSQEPSKTQIFSAHGSPPCILSWLDGLVSGKATNSGYNDLDLSSVNAAYAKTFSILRIFPLLYSSTNELNESDRKQCNRDHNVVRILIEEGFATQATLRDELPAGVALPLLEVLHRCRSDHEIPRLSYEDAEMWSLIGREDLCKNLRKTDRNSLSGDVTSKSARAPPSSDLSKDQNVSLEDKDLDGICPLEITSSMLFPEDNRIREVGRLLRSSRPVHLNVPRAIEVSDHDYERLKQEKLLSLSRRVLALPVGRGMFTIGNLKPVPAEPLPLPNVCLVGRVPPTNAQLALDTGECPADLKVWPEFHNGVAAGLRLPLEQDAGEMISKITRTWIVYNRPPKDDQNPAQNNPNQPNNSSQSLGHAHGGLLMALGLRGHLTTLEMTDIFDYLTHGTVTTTVGVLLGMAAK